MTSQGSGAKVESTTATPEPSANVTYAPTAAPEDTTDWTDSTRESGGAFDLEGDATAEGGAVAQAFVDVIQDDSLDYDSWLAPLEKLLRADAYGGLVGSMATAERFRMGSAVGEPEYETFGTGRLLGVTFTFESDQLYVMLTRETAEQPWRVAWWE